MLGFGSDDNLIQENAVLDTGGGTSTFEQGAGILVNSVLGFPSPTPGASVFRNQIIGNVVRGRPSF